MASACASTNSEMRPPEAKQPRTDESPTKEVSESKVLKGKSEDEEEWDLTMEDIYTQQHFETTADEIVDIIFNISLHVLTSLIPGMKKALVQVSMPEESSSEDSVVAFAEIDAGLAKYVEKFYSTLERNSDTLLLYLKRNIISLPENVVLPQDNVQIQYKQLVQSLQAKKEICGEPNEPDYTEENTADLLAEKAEKLREKLLERKLKRLELEHRLKRANAILDRISTIEKSVDSAFGEVQVSVREFILRNIAAAFELPVGKYAKVPNGTT